MRFAVGMKYYIKPVSYEEFVPIHEKFMNSTSPTNGLECVTEYDSASEYFDKVVTCLAYTEDSREFWHGWFDFETLDGHKDSVYPDLVFPLSTCVKKDIKNILETP